MAYWISWHVSLSIPENSTQKYPKLLLFTAFWSRHSRKFSKIKVFVFLNILKNFFPTYAWVPQIASQITETFWNQLARLLKNFNEIYEKLPVFLKGLCRHYNVTSIYCHLWRNLKNKLKKLSILNFFVKFKNTEKVWNSF